MGHGEPGVLLTALLPVTGIVAGQVAVLWPGAACGEGVQQLQAQGSFPGICGWLCRVKEPLKQRCSGWEQVHLFLPAFVVTFFYVKSL